MIKYLIKSTKFFRCPAYLFYFIMASFIGFTIARNQYYIPIALALVFFLLILNAEILRKDYKKTIGKRDFFSETLSKKICIRKGRRFLYLVFLVVFFLNILAPASPNFKQRILASLVIIFSALPTYFYLKKKDDSIPFLALFGGIYSLYYGIPIFILKEYELCYRGKNYIPNDSIEKALFLSLLGLLILLFAYYRWPGNSFEKILPKVKIRWDIRKAKLMAVIIGTAGLSAYYFSISYAVPIIFQQSINFIGNFSLISIGILFILQIKNKLGFIEKVFLWCVLIPIRIILSFSIGATYSGMIVIMFLLLIYFTHRKEVPWKFIILILLCLIPLVAMRSEFRKMTWRGPGQSMGIFDKSVLYIKTATSYFKGKGVGYSESFHIFSSRIANLMIFSRVVEKTPEYVPYWRGYTYLPLLTKFIPRILYPNKPQENIGHIFGHRYGILHKEDKGTSINLLQLVEMYVNFGVAGIIMGMFVLGIIYKSLMIMLGYKRNGEGGLLIGFFIFTNLLLIESNFSMVVGGIFYPLILLILINKLILES